jgi:hypothetical protein
VKKDPPASKREEHETSETFYDAETYPVLSYYSDSRQLGRTEKDISEKGRFGKAFHLTINYDAFNTNSLESQIFVRGSTVDKMLGQFTEDKLMGRFVCICNLSSASF